MTTYGVMIFDGAEELDYVGPWEVFTVAAMKKNEGRALLVAERDAPIRSAKGMRVLPDATFESAPPVDVLLVPGGAGSREQLQNRAAIDWIRKAGAAARWVTSVCTGALLLHEAGFTTDRRVTTHFTCIELLRARGRVTVLENVRFVRDGNLVTAAGVSAGIDMALWLVGQIETPAFAREVQRYIEYQPAPPYAFEA